MMALVRLDVDQNLSRRAPTQVDNNEPVLQGDMLQTLIADTVWSMPIYKIMTGIDSIYSWLDLAQNQHQELF